MEVERAFDISIPDQEAETLTTVGALYNSVWNHLEKKHGTKCNSQLLFYRLRKYFTANYKISRSAFVPAALINEIFPKENRREEYEYFSNKIQLAIPDLALTKPWETFLDTLNKISFIGGLGLAVTLYIFFSYNGWVFLVPAIGLLLSYLISLCLSSYRTVIPLLTVKDYTEKILTLNYAVLTKEHGTNRREVETVINMIIIDKIGVDPDEISPEKSFTDDLGVD